VKVAEKVHVWSGGRVKSSSLVLRLLGGGNSTLKVAEKVKKSF
jgi:hypothetical protein